MELQRRLIWAYEQFDKTVVFEHIAFPVVLITGLLMFFMAGWSIDSQWLLINLGIVIGFFIPLEILDISCSGNKNFEVSENCVSLGGHYNTVGDFPCGG